MRKVTFTDLCGFTDKQKEALQTVKDYKYVLYGGAMGGGKSYFLRWIMLRLLLGWAGKGHRRVVVGIFCEDYPALKDRQIQKISGEFPPEIGVFHADHKEYGKSFILTSKYGSGVIVFRNLDDPSKYQSAEFAAIGIDELTKNNEDTFIDLRTRLRWSGVSDTKFIGATNPGGIGHAWVKSKFLDNIHGENETEAEQFRYVQALATENPHLDEGYIRSLSGLPEERRRAFLEGDWDMFKGQYFTEFRKDIHTCDPFGIPEHWNRFMCADYGYRAPSAIYWCAVDEDGNVYIYRELYVTEHSPEQLADQTVVMTHPSEKIDYEVWDPAIWARKDSPESVATKYINRKKELTGKMPRLLKGNNDRVNGWGVMRDYLKPFTTPDGLKAKLRIFKTCTELIRTLPSMVYDEHKVEDLDTNGDDHGCDALRYGIMSRPKKSEILVGIRSRGMIQQNRPNFNQISPFSP